MKSELLLNKILNTTSTCIFWKDDQRRFVGVNQAFLDYYGFSSESELIGKTDEDMGWHSDPDPFKNDEWLVLNKGESTVRVHGKCMARGQERDILASKSPIYESGRIIGLVGTFEDVTSDYRQKGEIRKLTETLDHIPCGICIGQIRFGRIFCVSANEYFADMIGGKPEDFSGKEAADFSSWIHPDDWPSCRSAASVLCTGTDAMDGIYRFQNHVTGEYLWLRMKGCRARLQNDEEYLYFTFTNETELKNSEKRESALRKLYASSVDAAELVVWEYDPASHTVTFDKTGYTARRCQEIGLPAVFHNVPEVLYDIIPAEYHAEIRRFYDDVFAGKLYTTSDIAFRPIPDQAPLFLHLSYTTILDSEGKPVRAYGTSQDMTKEKTAELQYEHELTYMNTDRQVNFIAKGHYDLTENKILGYYKVSKSALDPGGMSYDGIYEKMVSLILYESDRKEYLELFSRKKMIARFHSGETGCSIEYRRSAGSGPVMWVLTEARAFENPSTGNIECFVYAYDVTKNKIQQQLSYNLHSVGYESVGLISIPEQKVTYYQFTDSGNDLTVRTNTVDYQTNMIEEVSCLVPEDERSQMIEDSRLDKVLSALAESGNYSFSYTVLEKNHEPRRKFIHCSYLYSDRSIAFLSVQDITAQYAKEQSQIARLQEAIRRGDAANRAKSDFLSRMSHDIRTPLNGIIGMTYLAQEQKNPPRTVDCLSKIDTSSKFLLSLINDVLDMAKAESGKIELHPEPYPVDEFANYINSIIVPLCEERNQTFSFEPVEMLTDDVPLFDKLRINQIVFNLLSNAIKYTPEGGTICYRVIEKKLSASRMSMHLDIIDNGIGMSREFQKILFDPFTQENRTNCSEMQGSGLGLAITKRLVDAMNGKIGVMSQLGKGTTFTVDFLLDCVRADKDKNNNAAQESPEKKLSGMHILLCEDHPLNQEIAKAVLEEAHAFVTVAADGEAGVRTFYNSSIGYFDCILMDIHMPVMDGYETAKTIRSLKRPDAGIVTIIAMTADAFADDVQKCFAAGMNGHIAKPIDPDNMKQTLASYIAAAENKPI